MTEQELREKLIRVTESCKLAGFIGKGMTFDGRDGGYSNQKEGYYDTKDAVKDLMQLITQYGDQRELEGRIDEVKEMGHVVDWQYYDERALERIAELKAKEVKGE